MRLNIKVEERQGQIPDRYGNYRKFLVHVGGQRYWARDIRGNRCKVITPEYVIKLDDFLGQTTAEIDFWENIVDKKDRKYFAAIIYYNTKHHPFLVQRRVKFRPGRVSSCHAKIVERMTDKYGFHDLSLYGDKYSILSNNWAIEAGTNLPLIFDYAV